ncbi:PspC domain-containing protein [Niveibacterium terrae]|uniref:PspC domain-containing protein n=1 Tax=Niveibacterium terrae TaxID=3373598 RepID=UPI003A8FCE75
MSVSDEVAKLHQLKEAGALSEAEFAQAKSRLLGGGPGEAGEWRVNGLRRSKSDRWLGGVCGGIARMTGVEAWIWRLLWTLSVFCAGVGLLAYILCWIFIPEEEAA